MQVNHSVTGAAKCPIGKHDLVVQRAELNPKNAILLAAVFEHTLSPSQPIIERKYEPRPKLSIGGGSGPLIGVQEGPP